MTLSLRRFVDDRSIPRLYFERGYFLDAGRFDTRLPLASRDDGEGPQRAGIATFVMRGKEYLVAITSDNRHPSR